MANNSLPHFVPSPHDNFSNSTDVVALHRKFKLLRFYFNAFRMWLFESPNCPLCSADVAMLNEFVELLEDIVVDAQELLPPLA